MKKTFILFVLELSSFVLFAQKVDLDKFTITYTQIVYPYNKIDSSQYFYSKNIQVSPTLLKYNADPKNSIQLPNMKEIQGEAPIKLELKLNDVRYNSFVINEREESIKDSKGVVTGKRKYYWYSATYTSDFKGKITGPSNPYLSLKELEKAGKRDKKATDNSNKENPFLKDASNLSDFNNITTNLNLPTSLKYTSGEFSSKYDAQRSWEIDNYAMLETKRSEFLNSAITAANNALTSYYGFGFKKEIDYLWILDSKKHPEYETQRNAINAIKDIIVKLDGTGNNYNEVVEQLNPVLDYFKSLPSKYPSSSKEDKKMKYGAYYNLSKLYRIINFTNEALAYSKLLEVNDYDKEDAEKLKHDADESENKMRFYGVENLHHTF